MEIPTTHEILLFNIILCAIVLFFGTTYAITLFNYSFFCVSNICSDSFRTLSVWDGKRVFLRRLYSWLSFCLQRNSSSLLLYAFPSSDALVLNHHSALQLSWLLNMCSRGALIASLNYSIVFSLFFFIIYPQSFLSRRAYAWVHPHRISILSLTMEKMCFATAFTQWEGSTRKDGLGISSWRFPFDDLRTWPQAPLDGLLSTAHIVLSLPLTMTSIITDLPISM